MSSISEDVYFEIFLKVPVKSLLACKCVCKKWFSLISNPDFVKMHLTITRNNPNLMLQGTFQDDSTRYCRRNVLYSICHESLDSLLSADKFDEYAVELNYPFKFFGYSVQLMSCCDGLVCLWFDKKQHFCLWNPATRENKILPKPKLDSVRMVAFGYDRNSSDYKLFAAGSTDYLSLFEIYSVRLNSWKSIEEVPYGFHGCNKPGVLVNGVFHWLAEEDDYFNYVVSLDISNEIFKETELPIGTLENEFYFYEVGVLEECLCLLELDEFEDHVRIWVMQNYGVRESWTVRYTIKNHRTIHDNVRLMWSFKSGEILFGGVGTTGLLIYDPKYGGTREPNVSGSRLYQHQLYFESLVSLKSRTPKKKRRNYRVQKIKKKLRAI